jgi:hypothetical protein
MAAAARDLREGAGMGPGGLPQGRCAVLFSDHGRVADNTEGAGDDDEEARMVEGSFGVGEIEGMSNRAA